MQLHVSPAALVHEVCSRGSTVPPLQRLAPRIPCRGHRVCERWTFDCGARPVSERRNTPWQSQGSGKAHH